MKTKMRLVVNAMMFAVAAGYSAFRQESLVDDIVTYLLWLMPIAYAVYNLYVLIINVKNWAAGKIYDEAVHIANHNPVTGEVDLVFKRRAPVHILPLSIDEGCIQYSTEILLYAKAKVLGRVWECRNADGTFTLVYPDGGRAVKLMIKFPEYGNGM